MSVAIASAVWLAAAIAAWTAFGGHDGGVAGGLAALLRSVDGHPIAPFALVVAFLVRPITLLPVTVLMAFTGFLLGPVIGFVVAAAAVVTTSLIPYGFARLARGGPAPARAAPGRPGAWRRALAARPFESVLVARLAMMPGDLVNVAAGMLHVPVRSFVAATFLGGAPGVLVAVLAGASIQGTFRLEGTRVDASLVVASAALLVVSLVVAQVLRRRSRGG